MTAIRLDDEGVKHLWNIDQFLQDYKAQHIYTRRRENLKPH
jgi:hypothetical protein